MVLQRAISNHRAAACGDLLADRAVFPSSEEQVDDNDRVKRAQNLLKAKEDIPMMMEAIAIQAQLTRAKFNALVSQGFTPEQALELSKTL